MFELLTCIFTLGTVLILGAYFTIDNYNRYINMVMTGLVLNTIGVVLSIGHWIFLWLH